MQNWLPLNYSFVRIQKSLNNPVFEINILSKEFVILNEANEALWNINKRIERLYVA